MLEPPATSLPRQLQFPAAILPVESSAAALVLIHVERSLLAELALYRLSARAASVQPVALKGLGRRCQ